MTGHITLRGENGALLTVSLPMHFSIQDRFDKGELTEVAPDGSTRLEYQPPADSQPAAMTVAAEMPLPKRAAPQTEWADYAVAQGMDPAEAAGMKRDELYMRYRRTA